ncbi:hypothetical protein GCM10027070_29100 [Barrientosiimonas humi]
MAQAKTETSAPLTAGCPAVAVQDTRQPREDVRRAVHSHARAVSLAHGGCAKQQAEVSWRS